MQNETVVDSVVTNFLTWLRRVIEEADKPLSLLLMVTLPLIAPIIPSIVTASNLEKYMEYERWVAITAAVVFAVVGYVSMITAIGSIMRYVDNDKNDREWLPVAISVGSYLIYVFALVTVNVVLEQHNGVDNVRITVTALMTLGLEIPSALLNGTRISNRMKKEEDANQEESDRAFEIRKIEIENQTKLALASTTAEADKNKVMQLRELELEKLRLENESRLALADVENKKLRLQQKMRSQSRPKSHSQSHSQSRPKSRSQSQSPSQPRLTPETNLGGTRMRLYSEMEKAFKTSKKVLEPADLVAAGFEKSAVTRYRSAWIEEHKNELKKFGF